jgi:hypothetical protein
MEATSFVLDSIKLVGLIHMWSMGVCGSVIKNRIGVCVVSKVGTQKKEKARTNKPV